MMDREIFENYERPSYPVAVKFEDMTSKTDSESYDGWVRRPADAEIIIVNNGELEAEFGEFTCRVQAGQGILINCGTRYRLSSGTETPSFYSLVFSPSFIVEQGRDEELTAKYYTPIFEKNRIEFLLLDEDNLMDETVLDRINSIIAVNMARKRCYEMLTKGYLCFLWVSLIEYASSDRLPLNAKNRPSQDEMRTKLAVEFIQNNFADPLTLEDIADKVHISRNECCRCFKRVLGITPVDYLVRYRVYEAARLIFKNPGSFESISELAFSVGFNNASYFNKMFRRFMECTPTAFTKQIKFGQGDSLQNYSRLERLVKPF